MIRPFSFLAAVALVTAPAFAQTSPPDPAALFAAERTAAGGAAWDGVAEIAQRGTFDGEGLRGPYALYVDPQTGYSKLTMMQAGTAQAQGTDAKGPWSQQGTLVEPLEDAEAIASARTAAYVARNGWWHPQTDPATFTALGAHVEGAASYDVVRVLPQGGDPIDVWFDPATHLIVKTVETPAGNVQVTTAYSDYRAVGGLTLPYALAVGNGNAKYDMHLNATGVDVKTELAAADIVRPQNARTGSIARGSATAVPFDLDNPNKGHIVVVARVNGSRPLHLIFDTGGANVVTPEVAREIGLHGGGSIGISGAGENEVSAQIASGATLQIGSATLSDQQFGILPLPPSLVGITGRYRVDGLIGYEVLKNFVVSIDYVRHTLTLTDPAAFRYGAGTAIHFKSATVPVIPAMLDGVRGDFMFDTGNAFYNTLSQKFLAANGLGRLPGSVLVQSSGNIGGALRTRLVRPETLQIGPYRIARPIFAVEDASRGSLAGTAFAGNVGESILSRFDLTLDYAHSVIYMQPNANFGSPFVGSRDGMSIYRPDLAHLVVGYVNPGSPAAKAGIRAGDGVLAIDSVPAARLGPGDVIAMEATKQRLIVEFERGATVRTTTVVLAELVP